MLSIAFQASDFLLGKVSRVCTDNTAPVSLKLKKEINFSLLPFGLIWDIKNFPPSF